MVKGLFSKKKQKKKNKPYDPVFTIRSLLYSEYQPYFSYLFVHLDAKDLC